ncbi:MAG TPA: YbaB/EbfC family nucleoid-associated protein [Verrucomicrobiae bacterium]|nr:YbaB/EbfC family nucleoid-associated protein [Verrucomicrobiae bacterium]
MAGLGKFLKQAQKMQAEMTRVQEELAQREVEGTAGGGAVKAIAKCDGTIASIKIDPKVVDPKDVEMLEDLVLGAVTNALQSAKKTQEEEMGKVTAGMQLPGMM